jgi:hypothetical protein
MKTHSGWFQIIGVPICVFLVILTAVPRPLNGQEAIYISPALSLLIQDADQIYAQSAGTSMQQFFDNGPSNAAIVMGLVMHGQKLTTSINPGLSQNYEALRQEAHEFLGQLARVHGYRNPLDGQPMTGEILAQIFDRNASGAYNAWAVENSLPNPAHIPRSMILLQVSPESLARLHLRPPSSVTLFGLEAPAVGISEDIGVMERYLGGGSPTSIPEAGLTSIREEDIIGVWYAYEVGLDSSGHPKYRLVPGRTIEFRPTGPSGHYQGIASDSDWRYVLDRVLSPEQTRSPAHKRYTDGSYSYLEFDGRVHGRLYAGFEGWPQGVVDEGLTLRVSLNKYNRRQLTINISGSLSVEHVFYKEPPM